jgi:hypothetical protein
MPRKQIALQHFQREEQGKSDQAEEQNRRKRPGRVEHALGQEDGCTLNGDTCDRPKPTQRLETRAFVTPDRVGT